ncbi:MAG: hypothetical protein WCG06_02735 [Candidatus Omnitrophota bacterium]
MLKAAAASVQRVIVVILLLLLFVFGFKFVREYLTFQKIIHNLKAESRLAEVLVVDSSLDEFTRKYTTTIKFLEYGVNGNPLKPKYFTFKGNLIQFQTLVVRFDDRYVEQGHRMRGKSIVLFLKAFVLDGKNTQEFIITPVIEKPSEAEPLTGDTVFWRIGRKLGPLIAPRALKPESIVPEGYRVGNPPNYFEREVWARFWKIALDPAERKRFGIKNAQVEAPGSVFIPGTIYTLIVEHDGGVRIDARPIPEILKS